MPSLKRTPHQLAAARNNLANSEMKSLPTCEMVNKNNYLSSQSLDIQNLEHHKKLCNKSMDPQVNTPSDAKAKSGRDGNLVVLVVAKSSKILGVKIGA